MPNALAPEIEDNEIIGTAETTTIGGEYGQDATITPEHIQTSQHEATDEFTFVLKTHDGKGYVLPYLPWEATKTHIEQIYRLQGQESFAEAIKDGNFSMLTKSGNIILPLVWESVIKSSAIVQVSLPSDILDPDIATFYPTEYTAEHRYRPSIRSESPSTDDAKESAVETESSTEESEDGRSESQDESDIEDTSSESELSETSALTETTDQVSRTVIAPVDDEGNSLSFQINTAFIGSLDQATENTNTLSNEREPQQSTKDAECLNITKAVSVKVESRSVLQLHVLKGPRSATTHSNTSMRWYHLHSERLDFAKFKETCLGISGLSERIHKLTRKLFERVEKEKLKAFLDGMFIEPGTVLRADESHHSDPQSVIFSCIPYFDLQKTVRKASVAGRTDRLFPSRTLMQSFYPYEPVRERDAEQAYRKFGNEKSDALVHVPNIWMVNIGSDIVATCGHQPLSKEFVQSIEVIKVSHDQQKKKEDHTENIRLTDWDGRKLLFSSEECRTFFQMEQRLRELRLCSGRSRMKESPQLSWQVFGKNIKVAASLWAGILRQKEPFFIDLSLSKDQEVGDKDNAITELPPSTALPPNPFFHWPPTRMEGLETDRFIHDDNTRSIHCLEHVEKAILSEVLRDDVYGTYNAVEKTFTSTVYYRALPEYTSEYVKSEIESLTAIHNKLPSLAATGLTVHQALVNQQHGTISQKTSELYRIMCKMLALFVVDPNKSTVLRKSWGAMKSTSDIAAMICKREPVHHDTDEHSDPDWTRRFTTYRGWFVRPRISDTETSTALQKLKRTLEKCRKCRTTEMYSTQQAALSHLQKHLKHADAYDMGALAPEEWIVNYTQKKMEVWNEGSIDILTKACQTASKLFVQAKELSDGVRGEDGQTSELYTFPRALLNTLRQVLVFYFAVERAMYYTEDSFEDKTNVFKGPEYMQSLPFSLSGLQVIETFGNGAKQSIELARIELCSMVESPKSMEIFSRLSLSPEYVCGWFMRRLIVKPLEKSMTVSDMYREYLSTIQFQVNHRPGKRLLRSINLLQEELTALLEVNTQQMKLISNYTVVLDDTTYEKDIASRRAMFPYERMLLASCQDNLKMTDQEYRYLLARCGPLSDSTKQSLEINEEDHGKAIMVFTIVTVIFLPLSFVTSFLGMNTTDIRDMSSSSSLFWAIAVPLTVVTMGSILYIGYNGDEIRNAFSTLYRIATGKQDRSASARGISVAQRKRARKSATDSTSTVDFSSLADEAEFANPRPEGYYNPTYRGQGGAVFGDEWEEYAAGPRPSGRQYTLEPPTMKWEPYVSAPDYMAPNPRTGLRRADATIYNKTRVDDRHPPVSSYPPPPPPIPSYSLFPSAKKKRPFVRPDYVLTDEIPIVRRSDRRREELKHEIVPEQYEWTKKSHKHHRPTREGTRRRRTTARDEWL